MIMGVRYVQIFGTGIKLGDFATLITSPDAHIHLTTWISGGYEGKITIGDFCLISPGVRISAATNIEIGNSCMFANNAYISDSDWHDIYDRAQPVGQSEPIKLEENVWIDPEVNEYIWKNGIENPPRKIKLQITRHDEEDIPIEVKLLED